MATKYPNTLTRLLSKRVIDPVTGCWNWKTTPSGNGYPYIQHNGKSQKAARVAVLLLRGIDLGKQLGLHSCDNKRCFNPDHIHAGNTSQNMREFVERGEHWQRTKKRCRRGHLFNEANTRVVFRRDGRFKRVCRACVRMESRKLKRGE